MKKISTLMAIAFALLLTTNSFGQFSIPYSELGQAVVTENAQDILIISNIGSSGNDGIQFEVVDLQGTKILGGPCLDPTALSNGAFLRMESEHNSGALKTHIHSEVDGDDVIVTTDFSDIGADGQLVTIYMDGEVVASQSHAGAIDLTMLGNTMSAAAAIDELVCSGEDGTIVYIRVWLDDAGTAAPTMDMKLPNGTVHTGNAFSVKAIDPSVSVTSTEYASLTFKDINGNYEVEEVSDASKNGTINSVGNYSLSSSTVRQFPNPFAEKANLQFQLPTTEKAALLVFDIYGNQVANLFDGTATKDVLYSFEFDATGLANGLYIYQLSTAEGVYTGKIMKGN